MLVDFFPDGKQPASPPASKPTSLPAWLPMSSCQQLQYRLSVQLPWRLLLLLLLLLLLCIGLFEKEMEILFYSARCDSPFILCRRHRLRRRLRTRRGTAS